MRTKAIVFIIVNFTLLLVRPMYKIVYWVHVLVSVSDILIFLNCEFPFIAFVYMKDQWLKIIYIFFLNKDRKGTPKIIQLIRQAQGLAPNPEEESALKKLTPHVPGIVTFANHSRALPWTTSYTTVLMFADISGYFDKVVNFFITQPRWYRGF